MKPETLLPDVSLMLDRCGPLPIRDAAEVLRMGVSPEPSHETAVGALRYAVRIGAAVAVRLQNGRWAVGPPAASWDRLRAARAIVAEGATVSTRGGV